MNVMFRILGCHWRRWLGVFITSNHFLVVGWVCCWWAHRTVRWCTGQVLFTIRCAPRHRVVGVWSVLTVGTLCHVAAPDNLVPHQTCPVCSDFLLWLLTCIVPFCSHPLALGYRCSVGSPDMSGAHRTVWWIIADHTLEKPESGWFECCLAWGTGHCPVRHLAAHSQVLLQILLSPQLNFFLVCVEPYAPEINVI
jgi:hypothetical protein